MNTVKKLTVLLILFLLAVAIVFAQPLKETVSLPVEKAIIVEFEKYGHASLDLTIDKLLSDGYELGDTVDVEFSNGYTLENIPFLDGYYVAKGEALLRAYPGHDRVAVCINYGKIYEVASLSPGDRVTISLNTKGGALELEVLNSLSYTTLREDYPSDEAYANFREISVGNIGPGKLYRSCSPLNNKYNRASFADFLIASVGIKTILNLADTDEEIASYITSGAFNSPYYRELYETGHVTAVGMSVDFSSSSFRDKLALGIKRLIEKGIETPLLIHCTEGKDRAGFVSALIEALMGAGYDDIVDDYMKSYENYYRLSHTDTKRWNVIVKNNIDEMVKTIAPSDTVSNLTPEDLSSGARNYLLAGGMTEGEIDTLIEALR